MGYIGIEKTMMEQTMETVFFIMIPRGVRYSTPQAISYGICQPISRHNTYEILMILHLHCFGDFVHTCTHCVHTLYTQDQCMCVCVCV